MTDFQNAENEIMREKAVMVKSSLRISNGYLLLTNMRLLYQIMAKRKCILVEVYSCGRLVRFTVPDQDWVYV